MYNAKCYQGYENNKNKNNKNNNNNNNKNNKNNKNNSYHSQLIIVIIISMIIVIIIIIKRIAIIKVMRMGRGMGTIIDGGESFSRQETRDRRGLLPSTPPLFVLYFYHKLLLGIWVYYLLVVGVSVGYISRGYLLNRLLVVGGIYFF